jgi:hypothetical protein
MKKILYGLVIVGVLIWFLYPSSKPEGTYISKYHQNTIDTIFVLPGGKYKQSITRKIDGERLFENEGEWSYKNGKIRFVNFFQSDDVVRKANYDYGSVLITFSVPLETNFFGRPVFDYDQEVARYRYYKVIW